MKNFVANTGRRTKKTASSGLGYLSGLRPVKVIAMSAGKGGVGKSSIALNLAIALAKNEKKVFLLDADLGLANLDIMLGIEARYNLFHVLQGFCPLQDILIPGPAGIYVIPAASGAEAMTELSPAEHAGIVDSFNELTDEVDYLIIDTAAGISDTVLSFIRSSQELIVIACDEPTSLSDAYALMKIMNKRYDWSTFHILANMIEQPQDGLILFNKLYAVIDQFLDANLNYLGAIPFDEKLRESVKRQKPLLLNYPKSAAAAAISQVADKVEQWQFKQGLGGNTSFFLERLGSFLKPS